MKSIDKIINTLFHGDNLSILTNLIPGSSVDLIYLDPPFMSGKDFQLLQNSLDSDISSSQDGYSDKWQWSDSYEDDLRALMKCSSAVSRTLSGFEMIIGKSDLLAYIVMLTQRLLEMKRVLKVEGSIYLHCDQRASAYLRLLMDGIFGSENFLNQIIWCYGLGGSSPRYWPRKHDDILWYSRSKGKHYFTPVKIPATSNKMKGKLKKAPDYWYIPTINNLAKERCGYPTQKPEALLERIIVSSCPEGGITLDPFSGSGTTLITAAKYHRSWIGIEQNDAAIEITRDRYKRKNIHLDIRKINI